MRTILRFIAPLAFLASAVPALADGEKALVPAGRAVEMFKKVCLSTVEGDFKGATRVMAKYGVKQKAATGTIYSATEDLSFAILDGPGFGKTCSMVFASKDKPKAVQKAVPKLAPFRETPFGLTTIIENRILVIYEVSSQSGLYYHSLKMFSDRG